jgi:hypothetical protein
MRFTTIDDPEWLASCARCASTGAGSPRAPVGATMSRACGPVNSFEAGPPPRAVTAGTHHLRRGARQARVAKLAPSLAHITFDMPFAIAGITERNYHGTGLIVDAARGLVVTTAIPCRCRWEMCA